MHPVIFDFAPHAIHYAGASGDRCFVSFLQYPWLLTLDSEGCILGRVDCPNVDAVVDGRIAIAYSTPRVPVANVQRTPDLGPFYVTGHDVLTGEELWRRPYHGELQVIGDTAVARCASGGCLVDLSTGKDLWATERAVVVHAHDQRHLYVTDEFLRGNDGKFFLRALDRKTGSIVWAVAFDDASTPSSVCASENRVWCIGHGRKGKGSRIFGLSAADGRPVAEHVWPGKIGRLVSAGGVLLIEHESGIAILENDTVSSLVDPLDGFALEAHDAGFACSTPGGMAWTSDLRRPPVQLRLRDNDRGGSQRRRDWHAKHLEHQEIILLGRRRLLRLPLSFAPSDSLSVRSVPIDVGEPPLERGTVFFAGESRVLVEHATRGRFWFDVSNTGLAKGDPVEIGGFVVQGDTTVATVATTLLHGGNLVRVDVGDPIALAGEIDIGERTQAKPKRKPKPSKALLSVIDVLATHGFMDALSPDELEELLEDVLGADYEVGPRTVADVLSSVHEDGSGVARGVVVHDHRFGNETDDVVAEFAATLHDEPIAFAQVGVRDDALQIRAGDEVAWVPFVPGGLDAIARWLNARLEAAGAKRRIFSLQTDSDFYSYIVCPPETIDAMKRRRVRGVSRP